MPPIRTAALSALFLALAIPTFAKAKVETKVEKAAAKAEQALENAGEKAEKAVDKAADVADSASKAAEKVGDKAVAAAAKVAGLESAPAQEAPKPPKPFLNLELEAYLAGASKYDEYPKEGSADQRAGARVYGPLPTTYGSLKVEGRLWRFLLADAGFRLGSFSRATMTLKQQQMGPGVRADIENDIDGRATAWNLDLILRPLEFGKTWRSKLDCFVGYENADAVKEFYDGRPVGGSASYPGNFGRFKINYRGAYLGLRGQFELIKGLSLGASILGTPWLSNSTSVEGSHLNATLSDNATGRRYRWDAGLSYAILGGPIELGAGYRYEDIYFDATDKGYSLEIVYAGPTLKAGYRF